MIARTGREREAVTYSFPSIIKTKDNNVILFPTCEVFVQTAEKGIHSWSALYKST